MNIWTKVNGKWAVCGPDVRDFATVEVTKKDGTKQTVDLGKVEGTKVFGPRSPSAYAFPRENQSDKAAKSQNICAECGEPGKLVVDMEDGLRKHYRCCDIPPQ